MGLSDAEVDFGVAVDEVRGVDLLPPHCNGVGGSGWLGTRSTAVSCISYPDAKRAVVRLPPTTDLSIFVRSCVALSNGLTLTT